MSDTTPREPDGPITPEEMLAVREHVRARLIHELHSFTMTARLWRRVHNIANAQLDEARAGEIRAMLRHLADEPEPARGTSVRLREQ